MHRKGLRLAVHFSSNRHDWRTPQDLFTYLHAKHAFTHDAAAVAHNAKVPSYFGPDHPDPIRRNALLIEWPKNSRCWLNPPYGRDLGRFVAKVDREVNENPRGPDRVVLLIPARPDTKAWQEVILQRATRIYFVAGRLKFDDGGDPAPFPSALVAFLRGYDEDRPTFRRMFRTADGWQEA